MSMVKGKTNCQRCIDCLRMIDYRDIHNPNQKIVASKCYGDYGHGEMKKIICEGLPPSKAPDWCPHRKPKPALTK